MWPTSDSVDKYILMTMPRERLLKMTTMKHQHAWITSSIQYLNEKPGSAINITSISLNAHYCSTNEMSLFYVSGTPEHFKFSKWTNSSLCSTVDRDSNNGTVRHGIDHREVLAPVCLLRLNKPWREKVLFPEFVIINSCYCTILAQ